MIVLGFVLVADANAENLDSVVENSVAFKRYPIVPYPRELIPVKGECSADVKPDFIRVPGIPAEGYELSIIREILAYAAERHVTVVPEIEFPGHFLSVLCAYPEFACNPEGVNKMNRIPMVIGVQREVMCVGNPDAVKLVEAALDKVCELFPSKVIHIGGDEMAARGVNAAPIK